MCQVWGNVLSMEKREGEVCQVWGRGREMQVEWRRGKGDVSSVGKCVECGEGGRCEMYLKCGGV